ncbi:MAG: protein-L-isoaspartate(D-aspartate) O-methyltransferase [Thermoflexales bacterium]|nr:protein-L-isoaspartate(D-aspartate) O-methyltransferase [Thermoflexales bacterium]
MRAKLRFQQAIPMAQCFLVLALCLSNCTPSTPSLPAATDSSKALTPDPYVNLRQAMVADQIKARYIEDPEVLMVLELVPRHLFVPEEYVDQAYEDHPLPIGYGQTISQPYIVGLMTDELQLKAGDKVLEIGTGSGYQAAVLAALGFEVYSVEIIPELAQAADERLKALNYPVQVKLGDGYLGWEEHAPYDAIIVTAAPDHVPQPLVKQLKEGGRLVIPVGPVGGYQKLWRFTKVGKELQAHDLGGVLFVPLVREK